MRSQQEVKEIFERFEKSHLKTFGVGIVPAHLEQVLHSVLLRRLERFVSETLGHLPNCDFFALCQIFKDSYGKKTQGKAES